MSKKVKSYMNSSTKAVAWSIIGFSAFVVLCLLTGEFFLGGLGNAVSRFFRGVLGLSSYAVFLSLLAWGIFKLSGKNITAKPFYVAGFVAMFVVVVLLVHLFTSSTHIAGNNFSDYLNLCYNTDVTTTFGGVLAGLIIFPLVNTVGTAVTYVLLFALLAGSVFIIADYLYVKSNNPQKVQRASEFLQSDISGEKGLFVADVNGSKQLVTSNTLPPIKKQRTKDERDKSFFELYGGILNGETDAQTDILKSNQTLVNKNRNSEHQPVIVPSPQIPKESAHEILYGDIKPKPKSADVEKGSFNTVYQPTFNPAKSKPNFDTAYTSPIINNPAPARPAMVMHTNDKAENQNLSEFGRMVRDAKQAKQEQEDPRYADIRALKANNQTNDANLPPIINGDKLSEEIRNRRSKNNKVSSESVDEQPKQKIYPYLSDSAYLSPAEIAERNRILKQQAEKKAAEQASINSANVSRQTAFTNNPFDREANWLSEEAPQEQNNTAERHIEKETAVQTFYRKPSPEDEVIEEPFNLPLGVKGEESYFDEKTVDKVKPVDIFTSKAPLNREFYTAPKQETLPQFHEKPFGDNPSDGFQLKFSTENLSGTGNFSERKAPPVIRRLTTKYNAPTLDLLDNIPIDNSIFDEDFEQNARTLEQALSEFRIDAVVTNVVTGPTVTRYELQMAPGISVKKVSNIADDIAMRLSAKSSVRIEAPIPGKNLFGIEVPNTKSAKVSLYSVLESNEFLRPNPNGLSFGLGIDIGGHKIIPDLSDMPHLLVAGSTGTGKSVCLNALIISLMYKYSPQELRFILIDPKRVEFNIYNDSPHMMIKESVCEPEKAMNAFSWLISEMERRYLLFKEMAVKDIVGYNRLINTDITAPLARIVLIVDELSDLMTYNKAEIEARLLRLAQKARAAGIHLVFATQRPSVNIITGTIKANLPCRIALRVISTADSKTILDQGGPEKLIGKGDMLYLTGALPEPLRLQGAYVSTHEVQQVVEYIKRNNPADFDEDAEKFITRVSNSQNSDFDESDEDTDVYFVEALSSVIEAKQASISMLQRRFSIGYNRAGKLIEDMERKHFITAQEGSKPRQVLITRDEFEQLYGERK